MKPRHTFESVVAELINGLNSGTIVLDREKPTEQTESTAVKHKAAHSVLVTSDLVRKHRLATATLKANIDYTQELCRVLAAAEKLNDLSKVSAERAEHRLWLLVGHSAKNPAQLSFWEAAAQARALGVPEVRIMVAPSMLSEKVSSQIKERGLEQCVRITKADMDGWLAFRDRTLLGNVPRGVQMKHYETSVARFKRYKKYRNTIYRLDEQSDPEDFRGAERIFEQLWNAALV